MAKRTKTKKIHPFQTAVLVTSSFVLALSPMQMKAAFADSFDAQIQALQQQVNGYQDQAAQLRQQADTYQNKVSELNAEKAQIQAQIDLNNAKIDQLNQQISDNEQKMEQEKAVLGDSLVSLYLDSSVSPLELLASSNSISDYIDKQEYRDTIREQSQNTIGSIKKIQADLAKQKQDAQDALTDQQTQRDDLAAKEGQQADLLAQTQGQEAAYQQQVTSANAKIADLRIAQAAANTKWGGAVNYQAAGGGYPAMWANAPLDAYVDDWGMYTRECVSFAAFKVAQTGRYMPYGLGNAIQWPGGARARGISVTSTPKAGDVAIWPVGYYGHAMYVYSVGGDGSVFIGEYNYDWTGRYSERVITQSTWQAQGFQFIHF